MPGRGKFFEDLVGQLLRHIRRAGGHTAQEAADEAAEAVREQMFRRARQARDDLADEISKMSKRQQRRRWVVTGAVDPETGIARGGHNGPWGCAEDGALDAINEARRERGLPPLGREDVYYSEARDTRQPGYRQKPVCERNCQHRSHPDQYPDGTEYERGGPWDNDLDPDVPWGGERPRRLVR